MPIKFNIWEGIYTSFEDAHTNSTGEGFDGYVYNNRAFNAATECLAALNLGKPIPPFHKQRSNLLPPVTAIMLNKKDCLSILDFGGGLGIGYMTLKESIPFCSQSIKYNIVELPEICIQGLGLFPNEIAFYDTLPRKGRYDLVHSASALQYIDDWKGLLLKFASYQPKYILLSDVFAGSIPTFVTLQNYYGSKIKHWFFNLNEFISYFNSIGYNLNMKSYVNSRRLESDDILPMQNFPESHQLEQTLHLLFSRK